MQKGDFILINYIAKVKETSEVFDTTYEEVAKKENLQKEGDIYEPRLIVVGEGWVLRALDESFATMEPNKPAQIEIPPEKAFGQRDPEKIKRVPIKQLVAKGINPAIGMRIEYGGKNAVIRSIGAGRVLLDFNPPLAGKTLTYEVVVEKKLESNDEKIAALIHRRIPITDAGKFKFAIQEKTLTIDMPEETFYVEGIQIAKRGIALDIQKFFPELEATKFVETFKAPQKFVETKAAATETATKSEAETKAEQ